MKIVQLEPLGVKEEKIRALAASLESAGHEFVMYKNRTEDTAELIERSKDADVVILSNLPYKTEVIEACNKLKMISVAFTGVDHVAINTCKEKGITVCNAAGYSTHSVAELAYGLMIAVLRRIVPCDAATRSSRTKDGLVGNELFGKTIGVIGSGAIGLRVAEIGKAFGCKILAYSRSQRDTATAMGIQYVSLETLMKESDIISLHVPLNESTKGLISQKYLDMVKPTAILINTARGPVVDSAALADALKNGKIAGAGIDVYETEPPIASNHPLLTAPNTVVAPHVAFATEEALYKRAEIVFDNITSWLSGVKKNLIV